MPVELIHHVSGNWFKIFSMPDVESVCPMAASGGKVARMSRNRGIRVGPRHKEAPKDLAIIPAENSPLVSSDTHGSAALTAAGSTAGPTKPLSAEAKHTVRNTVLALLGSNLFALFVGGIYEYLSLNGFVSMENSWIVLAFVWVVGVVGIIFSEIIWGAKLKHRVAVGVLTAILLGMLLSAFHVIVQRSLAAPQSVVSQDQIAEINKIRSFVEGDEMSLRLKFDYQNILNINVDVQNIRIKLRESGRISEFKYNYYTQGDGSFIFNAVNGKYHFANGAPVVDEGPNDIFFIVTTAKYQDSEKSLQEFINSALVPQAIKSSIAEYKKMVDQNFAIMMSVLDRKMNEDERFFREYGDPRSKYYLGISNTFAGEFQQLEPAATKVTAEISKYLKVN